MNNAILASSRRPGRRFRPAGYSLVEVLIAAAIVAVGLSAAAVVSLTLTNQQKGHARMIKAMNHQEQAARLHQLGLSYATITNILPTEPGVVSLTITSSTPNANLSGVVMDATVWTLVYSPGNLLTNATDLQTNSIAAVRPTLR